MSPMTSSRDMKKLGRKFRSYLEAMAREIHFFVTLRPMRRVLSGPANIQDLGGIEVSTSRSDGLDPRRPVQALAHAQGFHIVHADNSIAAYGASQGLINYAKKYAPRLRLMILPPP
jgi:hypothetical protein